MCGEPASGVASLPPPPPPESCETAGDLARLFAHDVAGEPGDWPRPPPSPTCGAWGEDDVSEFLALPPRPRRLASGVDVLWCNLFTKESQATRRRFTDIKARRKTRMEIRGDKQYSHLFLPCCLSSVHLTHLHGSF